MANDKERISTFEVIDKRVKDLLPWDKNPRDIDPGRYEELKKDLVTYTMLSPLLIDSRDGVTVLGGNMRLKALKEIGVEKATCRVMSVQSDKEAIMIALKDNEQFGQYLEDKLKALVIDIPEAENIKISLSDIEIGELQDWSQGIGRAGSGSEDELMDFLDESEESMLIKFITKKEYGEKVMEIVKDYAKKYSIEDEGLVLVELLEGKKYETLP